MNRMPWSKFLRFLIAGGTAAATNLMVLYLLTDWAGWWYLAASVISFTLSLVVGFALQKFWTFGNHSRSLSHNQFLFYVIWAVSVNLGLNTLLLYLLVDKVGLYYLLGQFITSALLAVLSFFVYQRFIFQPHLIPNE